MGCTVEGGVNNVGGGGGLDFEVWEGDFIAEGLVM